MQVEVGMCVNLRNNYYANAEYCWALMSKQYIVMALCSMHKLHALVILLGEYGDL